MLQRVRPAWKHSNDFVLVLLVDDLHLVGRVLDFLTLLAVELNPEGEVVAHAQPARLGTDTQIVVRVLLLRQPQDRLLPETGVSLLATGPRPNPQVRRVAAKCQRPSRVDLASYEERLEHLLRHRLGEHVRPRYRRPQF